MGIRYEEDGLGWDAEWLAAARKEMYEGVIRGRIYYGPMEFHVMYWIWMRTFMKAGRGGHSFMVADEIKEPTEDSTTREVGTFLMDVQRKTLLQNRRGCSDAWVEGREFGVWSGVGLDWAQSALEGKKTQVKEVKDPDLPWDDEERWKEGGDSARRGRIGSDLDLRGFWAGALTQKEESWIRGMVAGVKTKYQ